MGAQPQPAAEAPDLQVLQERLERLGVAITPSTAEGRRAVLHRDALRIPGVSLSELVVRVRDEGRADA